MLIDASSKFYIKKFVLISSDFINLPYTFSALIYNMIWPNILGYKSRAENYLRKSGLNYQIIRPGKYEGKKIGDEPVHNITVIITNLNSVILIKRYPW
jgi:hypothetical protein